MTIALDSRSFTRPPSEIRIEFITGSAIQDRIHHRQRDDDEQVGHLADRHLVRAVAKDREDREEAEAHPDA
jgi:hypothetical protein